MKQPLFARLAYSLTRQWCRLIGAAFFSFRVSGREHWPATGGALVCANHQSYLDPIIIGAACDRPLNYMARASLFRLPLFGKLMRLYNAFPVQREGIGIGGLKEMLRRLKSGEMVVIFPEGTRTTDGNIQPLQPGFIAVARRSGQPLVPVAMAGAFNAWPRTSRFPRLQPIAVHVGQPLSAACIADLSDEQVLEEVHQRLRLCHETAKVTLSEAGSPCGAPDSNSA